ncbi:Ubiquitin-protein ligase protein [Salix suchowensis]|nr:Ubiquitin-protein ligase protein [Salix suchowensis]
MASTPSDGEVAVFTDTNMDTHIAMGISPDITVADFKRELEKMHFNCFPKMGVVKVYELKVRRNNCFYHLLESLPVKYAFQGLKGNWFLHVAIRSSNSFRNKHSLQCLDAKDGDISDGSNATGSLVTDTRKNDMIPNGNSKRIKGLLGIKSPAELPKTDPCFDKRSKEKKRLAEIDKEFDRSKKNSKLAARECSGLLTPGNEVKPGTAELSKNAPYFKKMSKEKKRLADINNESERSKKTLNVAAKVSSGLLTPRNEVEHTTIAEALPKIVACSKKRSKEKKRMAGLNKELDRRKKAPNLAAAKVCSGLLTPKNQVKPATFSCPMVETLTERPQEVIFAKINDFSTMQVYSLPQVDIRTPPRTLPTDLRPGSSGNKLKTTSAVGKLMMTAANKLKSPANERRPSLSSYRFRAPSRASSVVRRSIFDISDSDG